MTDKKKTQSIVICIPTVTWAVPMSMVQFLWNIKVPDGYSLWLHMIERTPIDVARNMFIKFAVVNDIDWILFLDDDNVPESPDFLCKMISHGKKMVTGLVPSRKTALPNDRYRLCIFKKALKRDWQEYYSQYYKPPVGDLAEIDMCWAWCFLWHRDIFKPLYEKYQEWPCEAKRMWYYRIGNEWIPEDDVEKKEIQTGTLRYKARNSEDLMLFERAKRLTWEQIYADTTVWCTHIWNPKIVNIKEDIIAKNFDLPLTCIE